LTGLSVGGVKVLGFKDRLIPIKTICFYLLLIYLLWGLFSCGKLPIGDRFEANKNINTEFISAKGAVGKLAEVPPPKIIRDLSRSLEQYQPQVGIVSPKANATFNDTTISVNLQVKDLPIFKDKELEMGPYLNLILDNQPAQAVYNPEEPIILENLAPGTHTLRVFASRPWHESFKNEGAYAQTTFHILTKTNDNNPDPALALLTYSRPNGTYSAEPIMLDFYLTNAPLHQIAQQKSDDEIKDWHIKVTINGESFIVDDWQAIYLKGFQKGNNWIQLELIDEDGNNIENAFNNTVRVIAYDPKNKDTLAKLVEEKISLDDALAIVDPDYRVKTVTVPEIIETPKVESETETSVIKPETVESAEPIKEKEVEKLELEQSSLQTSETEISPEVSPPETTFSNEPAKETPIIEKKATPETIKTKETEIVEPEESVNYTPPSVVKELNPESEALVETREPTLETTPIPETNSEEESTTVNEVEVPTLVEKKKNLQEEAKIKTSQWLKNIGNHLEKIKNDASELLPKNSAPEIIEESKTMTNTSESTETEAT
jgi:hypothetical protein